MADRQRFRISVFGLGYVGAVTAAGFARLGHSVIGVDVDPAKMAAVERDESPVVEPGLAELIACQRAAGRLGVCPDAGRAVRDSDVSMICVGTPSEPDGSLGLGYVMRVCRDIGRALRDKRDFHVVVVRSTVLPGAVQQTLIPILQAASGKTAGVDFGVAQNPEFLREGVALADFFAPPRTVIGASDERTGRIVASLYDGVDGPVIVTDLGVASIVKYADNAFHAAKIVFANEVGRFCKLHGVDSHRVMDLFCQDRKLNLSPAYLRPGFAFGGSCLPKDLRAILASADAAGESLELMHSLLASNDRLIAQVADALTPYAAEGIGLLGLTFKPGTDDLRESPQVRLVELLLERGAKVRIYDPCVKLCRLTGANLRYVTREIPHLESLLAEDPRQVLDASKAIVAALADETIRAALKHLRADHVLWDLARVVDDPSALPCRYEGLFW